MLKSGITRRIDELGRIVVPKEIRYNLGIRDGEPLEIYTNDNAIIIKKYSQVENIKDLGDILCSIISDTCDIDIMITDREKIIATSTNLKDLVNIKLEEKHKKLIDNRESYISSSLEVIYNKSVYLVAVPIITQSDCSGLVIVMTNKKNDENLKYAKIVQKLLIQKLDIN